MPVMFINEYIVCIKSGQHITEARDGQHIQMTNGNYRGGGGLTFLAFPGWACRGCECETLHLCRDSDTSYEAAQKKVDRTSMQQSSGPGEKKSRGKGKYPQDLPYADETNVECILNLSLST